MILDKINNHVDLKKLTIKEKKVLAKEIREFLIEKISKSGGHLASNLGIVEITIALLTSFDIDNDKIIFDVGHQSYVYKILTGRKQYFDNLRKYKGLRGFPYRRESKYDFFETGHSSTSISAALGMARARDINKESYNIVSVIGDGSISNGMSLEAINDLGYRKTKMIIILNDNGMSISSNVGGISSYLSRISINEKYLKIKNKMKHSLDDTVIGNISIKFLSRIKDGMRTFLVPSKYFEAMGLTYIGPIDGHDIALMTKVFNRAKKSESPIIVHVVTKKGFGYMKAMENPELYHAVSPFNWKEGIKKTQIETYSSRFGKVMIDIAKNNSKIVAITAAMKDGVGLQDFFEKYPERSFDVGIAEEHAVTFAAGLATCGMIPVVAIYSTFLQRSFDQIIHDVCMQNLHVIFAIDHAGIVGNDGETHQGIFDLSYLSLIPNLIIISPKTINEIDKILKWSVKQKYPIAIRYPKGIDEISLNPISSISLAKWEVMSYGKNIAIIATGKMVQKAVLAKEKFKLDITIINAIFIKPVDKKTLKYLAKNNYNIITIEDNTLNGGLSSQIQLQLNKFGYKKTITAIGFEDKFIEQGSQEELYSQEKITIKRIKCEVEKIRRKYGI